jgi:DNA-directed RNA polymerase specialized sigma24 family protein
MEKLYEENKNLIKSFARNLSRLTGMDYDDLKSEGNQIFVECCHHWRQEKSNGAKFSTYLSASLYFNLYRYVREQREIKSKEIDFEEMPEYPVPDDYVETTIARATLDSLGRDAKICVDLALNPPPDMMKLIKRKDKTVWSKKVHKTLIRSYLSGQGWKRKKIMTAFKEVQSILVMN